MLSIFKKKNKEAKSPTEGLPSQVGKTVTPSKERVIDTTFSKLSTEEQIKRVLQKHPRLADNDMALFAQIAYNCGASKEVCESIIEIGVLMRDKKLPSIFLISRKRRIVEAKYPNLRGGTYKKRQEKAIGKRIEYAAKG